MIYYLLSGTVNSVTTTCVIKICFFYQYVSLRLMIIYLFIISIQCFGTGGSLTGSASDSV